MPVLVGHTLKKAAYNQKDVFTLSVCSPSEIPSELRAMWYKMVKFAIRWEMKL
ncbi:hypothetical protein ALT1644_150033 [Alteromonas macleodii]